MKILPDLIAQKNFPNNIMFLTNDKTRYCETGRNGRVEERKSHIDVKHYLKCKHEYITWYTGLQLDSINRKKCIFSIFNYICKRI